MAFDGVNKKGNLSTIVICAFIFCLLVPKILGDKSYVANIVENIKDACVIIVEESFSTRNPSVFNTLIKLSTIFENEEGVNIYFGNINGFTWPNGRALEFINPYGYADDHIEKSFILIPRQKIDRTCLLDTRHIWYPKAEYLNHIEELETLVEFVNKKCDAFAKSDGTLSVEGVHRKYILDTLFTLQNTSNITMHMLFTNSITNGDDECYGPLSESSCRGSDSCSADGIEEVSNNLSPVFNPKISKQLKEDTVSYEIPKCEVISEKSIRWEDFFHNYLKKSKPVIIKNVASKWTAFTKWTMEYFLKEYGNKSVHVKLTPGGDFEGVEPASIWEDYDSFTIPRKVRDKLEYPDLVVVRPAAAKMNFSDFLNLIVFAASQESRNVSAYLEYSSIPDHLPELEKDIEEFDFVKGRLKRRHLNLWLSDGNTLGRLHFDPYDNLLCQLRGKKQVILFEPHNNERLYEAHIAEATLKFNKHLKRFKRKGLQDSTSMVMSPVDIQNPDFTRFPLFAKAKPLNCTLDEGDVLFMPSFWWHEVYSVPNAKEKRNMAVNFWYEPFLQKEFPCPNCKLDVNPYYRDLL